MYFIPNANPTRRISTIEPSEIDDNGEPSHESSSLLQRRQQNLEFAAKAMDSFSLTDEEFAPYVVRSRHSSSLPIPTPRVSEEDISHVGESNSIGTSTATKLRSQNIAQIGSRQSLHPNTEQPISVMNNKSSSAVQKSFQLEAKKPINDTSERRPIWLHTVTLSLFCALFALMAGALLVLWRVDVSEHGIPVGFSDNAFYWKYGPTAVLVFVIGLWAQLEKYCKLLAPWAALKAQPSHPSHVLLLDYFSPLLPAVMWRSVRNRHFFVTISVTGTLILRLIVIASTALIVLTPTRVRRSNFPLKAATRLDLSNLPEIKTPGLDTNTTFVTLFYGNNLRGLPFRPGTSAAAAFQEIIVPDIDKTDFALTQAADVFRPTFSCVVPNIEILSPLTDGGNFTIQMDVPPCPLALTKDNSNNESLTTTKLRISTRSNETDSFTPLTYIHTDYYSFPCAEYLGRGPSNVTRYVRTWDGATDFFLIHQVTWTELDAPSASGSNFSGKIDKLTAIACNANFRLQNLPIKVTQQSVGLNLPPDIVFDDSVEDLPSQGLNTSLLEQLIYLEMDAASDLPVSGYTYTAWDNSAPMYYPPPPFPWDTTNGQPWAPVFQLFANAADRQTFSDCFDSTILKAGAEATVNGIIAQWARDALFKADETDLNASISYTENKLQIKKVPLWFMFAAFTVLASLSALLIFICSAMKIDSPPTCVRELANVLASDSRLHQAVQRAIPIELDTNNPTFRPYRPRASRKGFMVGTILSPLCVIALLEVLQQLSDKRDGFVGVGTPSFLLEAWTHYLPTALMVIIALCYSSLNFTISTFAPFSRLRKNATSRDSINHDLSMMMLPQAVIVALKTKNFGAALSAISVLCGSVLTIVVAGLYTVNPHTTVLRPSLSRLDTLNPLLSDGQIVDASGGGNADDGGAAMTLSIMDNLQLSSPNWTYNDIVIPRLSLDTSASGINLTDTTMEVDIPVWRGVLDCIFLPEESIEASYPSIFDGTPPYLLNITAYPDVPESCQWNALPKEEHVIQPFGGNEWIGVVNNSRLAHGASGGGIIYRNYTSSDSYNSEVTVSYGNTSLGCPTLTFLLASFNLSEVAALVTGARSSTTDPEDVAMPKTGVKYMQCRQKVQQLQATVQFVLPSFKIDVTHPPVLHEDTIRYLTNGTPGVDSFVFHPIVDLDANYEFDGAPPETYFSNYSFDPFTRGAFWGPTAPTQSLDELADPGTEARNAFYTTINRFYGRYMAQFMNAKLRAPVEPDRHAKRAARAMTNNNTEAVPGTIYGDDDKITFTGALTTSNVYRVTQQQTPKIVLQVLLGVMSLCACGAYWLVDMRDTLLWEPFSIAGKGRLLVGSRFLDFVSKENDRRTTMMMDETEEDLAANRLEKKALAAQNTWGSKAPWLRVKKRGVSKYSEKDPLGDLVLRLGWWDRDNGEQRPDRVDVESLKHARYGVDIART